MSVRRLTAADAELWRDLRLEMLRAAPSAYGTRAEEWADRPLDDWRQALVDLDYVASFAGERAVGAMGLWPGASLATRHRGTLIAVWLAPDWRGSGRAEAMLEAIVEIAVGRGIVQLELGVEAGNARAIGFYRRCGFAQIGVHPRYHRHDGVDHDELLMVRALDA